MIRFFADPPDESGSYIRLSTGDAAHIRSLRLRPDETFIVCDGNGLDYVCCLGDKDGDGVDGDGGGKDGGKDSGKGGGGKADKSRSFARIIETRPSLGEPSIDCTMYIAYSKGDRLDYTVQKCVELGACGIVLFPSERCVSLPGDVSGKISRLKRIAVETSKQCGRGRVPAVSAMSCFDAALDAVVCAATACASESPVESAVPVPAGSDMLRTILDHGVAGVCPFLPLFLYECEKDLHLKQALEVFRPSLYSVSEDRKMPYTVTGVVNGASPQSDDGYVGAATGVLPHRAIGSISIMTGPEGGFSPAEAELAKAAGMVTVSIGPRLLRCETAPVAALSVILYHLGEL